MKHSFCVLSEASAVIAWKRAWKQSIKISTFAVKRTSYRFVIMWVWITETKSSFLGISLTWTSLGNSRQKWRSFLRWESYYIFMNDCKNKYFFPFRIACTDELFAVRPWMCIKKACWWGNERAEVWEWTERDKLKG